MEYSKLSVRGFLREVQRGNVDLGDFYGKMFARLRGLQREYNLFVTLSEKEAFEQLRSLPRGRLQGLPVSVKDNICTEGIQSTAGSRILEGYKPPFDAFAVEKTKRAGAVVVGKTQMDEFGFGTFSIHSGFGVPKNPIDPARSCGGSSGGAAGLVKALDLPHVALAESTGGSISCPASFCGVTGLTPTYGLVSRWGLIDYANSLDKIGVIAKGVDDCGLMLEQIQGFDSRDFTSLKTLKKTYSRLGDISRLRIGVPREYFKGIDDGIKKEVWRAIHFLESQGASWKKVSLPHTSYALAAYYIIASAEASTNLAKYCGMRYGQSLPLEGSINQYFSRVRTRFLGQEAKRRILLGTFARMAGYRKKMYEKAFQVRSLVIQDFEQVFRGRGAVDVLAAPTMPILPPKFKEIEKLSPLKQYQMDWLTVPANLVGIPQLSVPFGSHKGLPVGIHLLADHLQEKKLLAAGKLLEKGAQPVEMG
ncbi:MAG: Asp-tRNA(Asn)/Glu-tRNA(Gln) amidotransferase subunit GatA [Candidatus Aenigmarchaeota archaeon]|nr:Asp-tRNA(Asn)/Glu-tRNA(Gln) amidotransferase subunit GatA [Candidatus Aenigmarchaeota archaeon]